MSKSEEPAIIVKNLSKSFKIPIDKSSGIKQLIVNFYKRRKGYREFKALEDVSFEIKKGEFFGIVGRNGSGKSTLLKTLAGVYEPGEGLVSVNGSLTPFIELGVGFNPELTGRENIFLNGALLGFSKKEMETMYQDIVDFAELHDFMEERLKNYSSGMQVRLAFSIAIRAESDILLLDEVLAVGDEAFQRKCYEYFARIKKEKRTVIFVSHDMDAVKNFCDRAVLVEEGKVTAIDKSTKIATLYSRLNSATNGQSGGKLKKKQWGNGDVTFKSVEILSGKKQKKSFFRDDPIAVRFNFRVNQNISNAVVGVVIQNTLGQYVFATNTQNIDETKHNLKANQNYSAVFDLGKNIFTNGRYTISGAIANADRTTIYAKVEEIEDFSVGGWSMAHALTHPSHSISILESKE